MKKILISVMTLMLVIGLVGAGTFAWFSDVETSTSNTFTAGTVDLSITGQTSMSMTNMAPGDSDSASITVENIGSLPGSLYATSWYVTADGSVNVVNVSDDAVAKMLLITAFTADTVDILSQIPDTDSDSRITVFDMVNDATGVTLTGYPASPGELGTWYSYDTDMVVNEVHTYALTVQFDTAAGNNYQGDGITLTFQFLLTQ